MHIAWTGRARFGRRETEVIFATKPTSDWLAPDAHSGRLLTPILDSRPDARDHMWAKNEEKRTRMAEESALTIMLEPRPIRARYGQGEVYLGRGPVADAVVRSISAYTM